jgi:hypothetical protein
VFRARRLRVETTPDSTTYELTEGDALTVQHRGESIELRVGTPVVKTSQRAPRPARVAPSQPFGRTPLRRLADSQRGVDDVE